MPIRPLSAGCSANRMQRGFCHGLLGRDEHQAVERGRRDARLRPRMTAYCTEDRNYVAIPWSGH